MEYGICNLSVVPVRKMPDDRSEMVTQLLFGEHVRIISSQKNWLYIQMSFDSYEGWIDQKQIQPISEETFNEIDNLTPVLVNDFIQIIKTNDGKTLFPIVMGSALPYFNNEEKICNLEGYEYIYQGEIFDNAAQTTQNIVERIEEIALTYLNTPYLWGGRTPLGIDCSGFTQIVYKLCGIKLLRDAYQQATQGTVVNFLEEAQTGDLAFFDNPQGKIVHVGIVLNNKQIIHASGKVRIDNLDQEGIYNAEIKKHTHHLRIIKRYI